VPCVPIGGLLLIIKKGTLIHKAAEFISLGLDDKIKVPEEFNSYIEQLIQFFTEINPDIIAPEVILFNSELLLGGMIDLITFNKDGTIDIYDWKTNKELKKSNRYTKTYSTPINHILDTSIEGYSLQLTVYKKMLEYHKFKVRDMFIVHITPDNYTVIKCKDYSTEINELFEVRKKQIS
jgi:ATP-dependent exoDNAse (exonuclease V) beta subunit